MNDQEPGSSRAILRAWIREQIAGQHDVQVPELAAKGIAHFQNEPNFIQVLLDETLPGLVASITYNIMSNRRGGAIPMGDSIVTRDGFEERVERSRFRDWMEHAGDRHVSLLSLTKTTGRLAVAERRARAGEELRRADFIERLVKPLRGNKTVGDHWTEQQIAELWNSLNPEKREDVA